MKLPAPGPARWVGYSLLTGALFLVAGCGERPAARGATAVPASSATAAGAPAAVGQGLSVPRQEPALATQEPSRPEPTARYVSLEAARDSIGALLRHTLSLADTAFHISRGE